MRDSRDQNFKFLPIYVLWGIWISRNKSQPDDIPRMTDVEDRPWGYFDGASQDGNSGVGMIIFLSASHFLHFEFGVGARTNNEAKLLTLWGIMKLARFINISSFLVFGDLKVIIDWFNIISNLHSLILGPWQQKVRDLQDEFGDLHISHVYREQNYEADRLSK